MENYTLKYFNKKSGLLKALSKWCKLKYNTPEELLKGFQTYCKDTDYTITRNGEPVKIETIHDMIKFNKDATKFTFITKEKDTRLIEVRVLIKSDKTSLHVNVINRSKLYRLIASSAGNKVEWSVFNSMIYMLENMKDIELIYGCLGAMFVGSMNLVREGE